MAVNTSRVFIDSSEFASSSFIGGWNDWSKPYFIGSSAKVTHGSGRFNFSFDGSGFAVSGFVPPVDKWSVKLDARNSYATVSGTNIEPKLPNPSKNPWHGVWMNTGLDTPFGTAKNNVSISGMPAGVAVDFVTLLPPFSNSIKGKKIIVDDLDQVLVYKGGWYQKGGKAYENEMRFPVGSYTRSQHIEGVPYSGGVTSTGSTGASVEFPFTGTSVSVYGILKLYAADPRATYNMSFSIDGNSPSIVTFPPVEFRHNMSVALLNLPNFNYYTSPPLDAGNHVLTIKMLGTTGYQVFQLDYITYTASFDSLDSMPRIPLPSTSTISPKPTISTIPTKPREGGPILGGAALGIILFVILAFALCLIRRCRRRRDPAELAKASADPFVDIEGMTAPYTDDDTDTEVPTAYWDAATDTVPTVSPEDDTPLGWSAINAAKRRIRELEEQVARLSGEVRRLRPPAYSDA